MLQARRCNGFIHSCRPARYWSEEKKIDAAQLKNTLSAIRIKGRYIPPRNHPLLSWWENAME
ncbi:MAG TPA: hypothetical protein DEG17_17155 [Cyanobacteria bacterium UBA11149]|nr:hypothetical protein [Cyanobacteria bacterium UBA11366]HBK66269.1 hypothetical protein [Cyanobacteria bacterium UBA11166]HBR72417.1 hypothetical protein [Cyanobacteria bacterium UBA11159]HBS71735.1 hypothetical protein [Cyanobacteria bacterium UBA11153]HBW90550.1 hypothetical protein [Cyanobacteria bacterium UBA11149]HCA93939.1 hypothetical protein [Cyanobacteria bacterium UBA9226]